MKKDAPAIPGQGDIEFILDGETRVLRPSLAACIGISRLHGSPQTTATKAMELDFDTITAVLAHGLGIKVEKKFQEQVYRTGLYDLAIHVIKFIRVVNNGGKLTDDEDEAKPDGDAAGEEGKGDEGNAPL